MNHIYRSIWNDKVGNFVAVSENAGTSVGRGASKTRSAAAAGFVLKTLAASILMALGANVYALPVNGKVTAGKAAVTSGNGSLRIDQSSQNVVLDWQSFSIGAGESVRFVQPNANAVALNRVLGSDPSNIFGSLSANGKVFLVNPNGILFGKGASVNVGGMVASTIGIADSDFMAGKYRFAGAGNGRVVNQGNITADGGYVALLGASVSNTGTIDARLGTVALAAGNAVTLDVAGDGLLNVTVDQGALNGLAENGGLLRADGGRVMLTAQAAGNLLQTAVNNTGIIQAQTIENRNGVIKLLGDMQSGTVNVGGKLDASAPAGGNGGSIETSAAHVKVAGNARITTAAAQGTTGNWLIDPTDYTIAASGGDITGTALSTNLASTDVTILSTAGGGGSSGNVNVSDSITWSANKLTLNAQNDINIDAQMNGSGTASLALEYGQGALASGNTSMVNVNAAVNLPAGNHLSKKLGSDGTAVNYTVITSLGAAGSTTGTDLQGMNANVAGNYALGANIDASATSGWNSGQGFLPVGAYSTQFTGNFDGLGHTINNIYINRGSTYGIGLFGNTSGGNEIVNVGMVGGSISGNQQIGALIGRSIGTTVRNSYSTANVSGTSSAIGGLLGYNAGGSLLTNSWASGTVTGGTAGGLVGENTATITNSYATGAVSGNGWVGGLVGYNYGTIDATYTLGSVSGGAGNVGTLVGGNNAYANVNNSYWNTDVNSGIPGWGYNGGGLTSNAGLSSAQMQTAANFSAFTFTTTPGATGNNWVMVDVDGSFNNAGSATGATRPMLASEYSATINNAHQLQLMAMNKSANYSLGNDIDASATGSTADLWSDGSFIPIGNSGDRYYGTFDGNGKTVSGLTIDLSSTDYVGLIGVLEGTVQNVNLVGGSITGRNNVGPLVGFAAGQVQNSSAAVDASGNDAVGGLVGASTSVIANSHATGNVVSANSAGGLTGYANNWLSTNYATGNVSGGAQTGGLVGHNGASVFNSYATGTVSGTSEVGGLAGYNDGGLQNSYATGTVTGSDTNVGGLAGQNLGNISNTYATGAVTGVGNVGALVGDNGSSVQTSFFDSSANGATPGIGAGTTSGATGLTAAQMKTRANFTSATVANGNVNPNWDYGGTWVQYDGFTAPLLRAYLTPLTVTANNASKTYDGTAYSGGNGVTYSTTPDSNLLGTLAYSGNSQGALNAGSYALTPSGLYSNQQGYLLNFVSGTLTVNPYVVNLSGSRVYNGTTTVSSAALSTGALVGGETLTLTGAGTVANKNVGTGKAVSLGTLALNDGTGLASNYTLAGGTRTVDITRASLTLSTSDVSKTYDGGLSASGAAIATSGTVFGSDSLSGGIFAFTDKNVGSGNKTVSVSGITVNDGNGGGNYNVTYADNTTSTISRLGSVAWIGGTTGNWFDPANWAGGAVPDLANVADVVIPAGVTVTFDNGNAVLPTQAGAVSVDSIGSAGSMAFVAGNLNVASHLQLASLDQSGGVLAVGGDVALSGFNQTGGSLGTDGRFTATHSFSQGEGSLETDGNIGITQSTGTATLGNMTTAGALDVTAVDGDIVQAPGTHINVTGTGTLSAPHGKVMLAGDGNRLGSTIVKSDSLNKYEGALEQAISTEPLHFGGNDIATSTVSFCDGVEMCRQKMLSGLNVTLVGAGITLPLDVQVVDRANDEN